LTGIIEIYFKEDQEAYTAAQNRFQAVSAGLSSNTDGEDATLNDQLLSKS
jgi:structural maintenance of chromosome 2